MKMVRLATAVLAAASVATATMTATAVLDTRSVQASEHQVLSAIAPGPRTDHWQEPLFKFIEMVEERLGDRLQINYLGQADVVPAFEQFEALHNGVVDVAMGITSYYTGQIPEAMSQLYTRLRPSELRESGYYDLMRKLHREKANVIYLANVGGSPGTAFRMYLNEKVTEPDFSGLRIRVSPVYVELVKALGGTPVIMPPSEIYTAIERGVIDGYGWAYGGTAAYGWPEVTKYAIDHGFYSANNAILINGDVWDGLPEDVRAELEEIGKELEVWSEQWMEEQNTADNELLKEAGVEFVYFSDDDRDTYIQTAYDAAWAAFAENHPDVAPELRKLAEGE